MSFLLSIVMSVAVLSGCATMFSRDYDEVTIESEPSGAAVYIGARKIGKTPMTKKFDRDTFGDIDLRLKKKDYFSKKLRLQKKLDNKALFNLGWILTTMGATSWGIDAASGAMMQYHPDSYLVELESAYEDEEEASVRERKTDQLFFAVANFSHLKSDIARGAGERLAAFHQIRPQSLSFADFMERVRVRRHELLRYSDPVALGRRLQAIGV